jgi:hypothetical protein
MAHDVVLLLGLFAWFGKPIDGVFLAAVLTVIGYSVNDSVVVPDRIRELLPQRQFVAEARPDELISDLGAGSAEVIELVGDLGLGGVGQAAVAHEDVVYVGELDDRARQAGGGDGAAGGFSVDRLAGGVFDEAPAGELNAEVSGL